MRRGKWLLWSMLVWVVATLSGCGGGGGGSAPTGSVEGYVWAPDAGSTKSLVMTRSEVPPPGFHAAVDCDVRADDGSGGRGIISGKTDGNGHFILINLKIGTVKITITPKSGFLPFSVNVQVYAAKTSGIGNGGGVSLISAKSTKLIVKVERVDTAAWPKLKVYVSVIDPTGENPIIGLTPDQIKVTTQSQWRTITSLTQEGDIAPPIATSLVVDRSGSMDGEPLADLKVAAGDFVDLLRSQDEADLISFADSVTLDQGFTSNKQLLKSRINNLQANGATSLYDAIWRGIDEVNNERGDCRAVIAMTDGGENNSSLAHGGSDGSSDPNPDIVIAHANSRRVPIYTIRMGDATRNRSRLETKSRDLDPESEMNRIATQTGGIYYAAATPADLPLIYSRIAAIQQQVYVLEVSDDSKLSGTCKLAVDVNISGLSGRAEASYLAKPGFDQIFFRQDQGWWANELVGGVSGCLMKNEGCLVTSIAMVYKYYGVDTDPGFTNREMKNKGCFTAGALVIPSKVPTIYNSILKLDNSPTAAPNWSQIDQALSDGHPVIVGVKKSNGATHFFPIIQKVGGQYFIDDPIKGANIKFEDNVYKLPTNTVYSWMILTPKK